MATITFGDIILVSLSVNSESLIVSFSSFFGKIQFVPMSEETRRKIDKVIRYNSMMRQRIGGAQTCVMVAARVCRSGIRIPGGWQFHHPMIRYNSDCFAKTRILNEPVKAARG